MADEDADDRPDGKLDDVVEEARAAFERCAEVEADNRRDAEDDLRFARLEEQWPEKVRRDRELEGRPCLTLNRMPAFIRQVVNDARQNNPAITVHPVDGGSDPEVAEIYNGIIRNIEQASGADVAYDTALDFAVTCGFGYWRVNTRYAHDETFDQDIVIERVANPFSIYGDPDSAGADSSDWNTAFVVDSMDRAEFDKRWRGADAVDWEISDYVNLTPPWLEGDRVMLAEYWRREEVERRIVGLSDGQVMEVEAYEAQKALFDAAGVSVVAGPRPVLSHKVTQRIMSGAEVLDTVEWAGRYIPIVPVYGEEVFLPDGKRVLRSLVRSAKDAQRNFNYWRSMTTELVALAPKAPFIGPKGAFKTDRARWETANVENHAFLEYDPVDGLSQAPQRQPFAGVPAGALQEALNASDDMKAIMGLHDASLGARSNETSGVAIQARQHEGDVSTFHYIDNLHRAIRHTGRILVDLIPKVYSAPRVVRILGHDDKPRMVPINQPVRQEVAGPDGQVRNVEKIYDLGAGRYDLTVRAGPSFSSAREQAVNAMIELIRAFPAAVPVLGDILVRNMDFAGADEISARLQALLPPHAQGGGQQVPPQMQQAVQALRQRVAQLTQALAQSQARAQELEQDQSIDAGKLRIDAYAAETDRLEAVAKVRRGPPTSAYGPEFPG